jgi:hypothetical protein
LIKEWLQNQQASKTVAGLENEFSVQSLIYSHTLHHRAQDGFDSRANKPRVWNFYMPTSLDRVNQINKL